MFSAAENDPDKPAAACVWLWTRAHSLCDGPAAAGPGWDASLTEGQIRLPAGVQCTVGKRAITDGAIDDLQHLTGDREIAYSALLARAAESDWATVTTQAVLAAERAVIAERFNGSSAAYRSALAQAGATVNVARGILGDELRREAIAQTLPARTPSAAEIATFYESYPDLLVRAVSAKPAPTWLGGRTKGLALDSIAPNGIFDLSRGGMHTLRTINGTYRVRVTGDAQPLGTIPLAIVTPAIRAALSSFARGAAFGEWTVARQRSALSETTCRRDDLPGPAAVELESFFLPFLQERFRLHRRRIDGAKRGLFGRRMRTWRAFPLPGSGTTWPGSGTAARLAGVLGAVERVVGALEERVRVVGRGQLGDAGGEVETRDVADRPSRDRRLDPPVELVGLAEPGLGEDHRELVAADAARNVGAADDAEHPLGRLGEHAVAGEVADPLVDRLEVVEVDEHEAEAPVVAVRARDLAGQDLVEVAAVVQAGQRVEVGHSPGLAEAKRVVEGGAGAPGDILDLVPDVLGELAVPLT